MSGNGEVRRWKCTEMEMRRWKCRWRCGDATWTFAEGAVTGTKWYWVRKKGTLGCMPNTVNYTHSNKRTTYDRNTQTLTKCQRAYSLRPYSLRGGFTGSTCPCTLSLYSNTAPPYSATSIPATASTSRFNGASHYTHRIIYPRLLVSSHRTQPPHPARLPPNRPTLVPIATSRHPSFLLAPLGSHPSQPRASGADI